MSKRLSLFLLCGLATLCYAQKKESFLIKKTPQNSKSKNVLKEDIGEELKKALHSCASLTSELGKLQQKVASLQKKLLSRVEGLVQHERAFKKAKKSTLTDALNTMDQITKKLCVAQSDVASMVAQMNNNTCLRTT